MNIIRIRSILAELMSQFPEIQGIVLVSSEGQPLIEPIGIDDNTTLILAGAFLYLSQEVYQKFDEQGIKNITVQGQEGYVIFSPCYQETFLLVKANKSISIAFLERNIHLTKKSLQTELQLGEPAAFKEQSSLDFKNNWTNSPQNNDNLDQNTKKSFKKSNRVDIIQKNSSIRYRGLPRIK